MSQYPSHESDNTPDSRQENEIRRPQDNEEPQNTRHGADSRHKNNAAKPQRTRVPQQDRSARAGGTKTPRNTSFRTPAALTTMPRNTETSYDTRRNRGYNGPQPQSEKKRADGRVVRQPFNGAAHLYEVVQARLARTQRLVEVNTSMLRLEANTPILIRFHRNILLATTVGCRYRRVAEINSLPFVIRVADEDDLRIDAENAVFEKHAHELASEYAISQNLQMKVLSTDLSHDHKNVTINFASDVRVDFREMVAYLAGKLKMRVEMFQLGLRNGTGLICGLGSCGQLLCCGRFLGQFDPVAVRQLRAQGLATNPKRISGVCGRLYCCMSYEYCDYTRDRRSLPKKGKRVLTRWGLGRVSDIDMLREDIVITYDNGDVQRMTPRDYIPLTDAIAADVEAGKIEFPIEPAKFYLNADPAGAYEPENVSRSARPSSPVPGSSRPSSRKSQASGRKVYTPKPAAGRKQAPVQAVKTVSPAAEKKSPSKKRNPAQERKNKPIGIVPQPEISPAAPNDITVPPRALAHAGNAEISHAPRPPRKVKARQSNLDENSRPDSRHEAGRSRRRSPVGPIPPQNPKPPENQG